MNESIIQIITKFNQADCVAVSDEVKAAFQRSLFETGGIELGVFTCPPINARLLFSDQPEEYTLTCPEKTSLEKGGVSQRIGKMAKSLSNAGVEPSVRIVIGDTDEEDYIFPVIPSPTPLQSALLETNRSAFAGNLASRLNETFPWVKSVDRYSQIDALFDDKLPKVDLTNPQVIEDMAFEIKQMRWNFGPGGYYEGLPVPDTQSLRKIVELKFATYARQGRRISQLYPNIVWIQNEFPLTLRTRMLNLLTNQMETPPLPLIYPIQDRSKRDG